METEVIVNMVTGTEVGQDDPEIIVFGDLASSQCIEPLQTLLHVTSNASLTDFFVRVSFNLRNYIGSLSTSQQNLFPRFTTLLDLTANLEENTGGPVLQLFLLSVCQSALFINYFGGQTPREYPSSNNTYLLSSCGGAFTAAAVSCSLSISSFVPLAVEAALVAFRTGLKSFSVGNTLSLGRQGSLQSWSISVSPKTDVAVQDLLEAFTNSVPSLNRCCTIWTSAITHTGAASLCGNPSVLPRFIDYVKDTLRVKMLNIWSPYHAPHLFSTYDVNNMVEETLVRFETPPPSRIRLFSSSGESNKDMDFVTLLWNATDGVLRHQIDFNRMLDTCGGHIIESGRRKCRVTSISCDATATISAALFKKFGIQLDINEDSQPEVKAENPTGHFTQSKIAIIGYSGRFPSADSNEAFWELLQAGRDVHREIPSDRFNWRTHYDKNLKRPNTSRVKYGCFIDAPGLFDARFFNISPREAENTDPAHRLAILTTYEAMEMAGFIPNSTPSTQQARVGVFFGSTSDDWREVNSSQNVDTYYIPGGIRAFCPGRISYFFRLSGPSISIDTACSSSLTAIQTACSYLWRGDCDTAVAGGTNVMTSPNMFSGLDRAHFLSATGNCDVFDDEADGYCRADAVGSVILKRLEDAEADNDPIFGVIVGANINHCGNADSLTRPNEKDQADLFKKIVCQTNYNPLDISVIEMHGTGTQAGDAAEMKSVLSTFVPDRERMEMQPNRPLYVGSVKANSGHAEAASGVVSLIKLLLMFQHDEIPPHCGIKTRINCNYPLDLAERGVVIASKSTPWPRYTKSTRRAAFLNNFSAAGGNTAMLLEDAPQRQRDTHAVSDTRHTHLVAVTAKTATSLVNNAKSLATWLERNPTTMLAELAYTTTARRMQHDYRIMLSSDSVASLLPNIQNIASRDPKSFEAIPRLDKRPRLTFTFTGQGCLYVGMAKELFEIYSGFRGDIHWLNQLAQSYAFPSFIGVIDGSIKDNVQNLNAPTSHLALLCVQIALVRLLATWGVTPSAVIGHSLGEYAALYAASVISAGDAIYLVGKRAELLERYCERGTHSMLLVKGSRQTTERLLYSAGNELELSCANHPNAHVVAGPKPRIVELGFAAGREDTQTLELDVPFAFHSDQMNPILAEFELAVEHAGLIFHAPKLPVISPLLGRVISAGEKDILTQQYLIQATRGVVDFTAALSAARDCGLSGVGTSWLEVGAHPLCGTMIKCTLGAEENVVPTMRQNVDGYAVLLKSVQALYLAGADIDWTEYHREFATTYRVLQLPRYAWELKNYWIEYKNDFCPSLGRCERTAIDTKAVVDTKLHKYISPAAQRVIEESHGQDKSLIIVESDIFEDRLLPVFQGHSVNGVSLCPSSLYIEIALTLGGYLLEQQHLSLLTTGLEIYDLRVDQPLIAKPDETTHNFRATATANWGSSAINFTIFSVNAFGEKTISHATLSVRVVPNQCWAVEWKRIFFLVNSRIRALELEDCSQRLKRRMVYKLFGSIVNFSDAYQGISQLFLNSDDLEAVATIDFQVNEEYSKFGVDARWVDSLAQISGFIMNGSDTINTQEQAFINHGCQRLRYAEKLEASKTYRAYCRMERAEKTTFVGDVFILDKNRIVAVYEGLKFIGIQRRVLNHLLPSNKIGGGTKPLSSASPQIQTGQNVIKDAVKQAESPIAAKVLQPSTPSSTIGSCATLMRIIGQEIGVSISEIQPDTHLAELGVDSLLSLNISSRIRQELAIVITSAALLQCTSVVDLQRLVAGQDNHLTSPQSGFNNYLITSEDSGFQESCISVPREAYSANVSNAGQIRESLRELISTETAAPLNELLPSTLLLDLGIDSLLSLTITARLCEKFGVDISGTLVTTCDTLSDLEAILLKNLRFEHTSSSDNGFNIHTPVSGAADSDHNFTSVSRPVSRPVVTTLPLQCASIAGPAATSVLLGGSVTTTKTILIFFPDGSGSASSYVNIAPRFPSDVAIYGLNCPWRKSGRWLHAGVTIPQIVAKQLAEVLHILNVHKRHGWRNCVGAVPSLVLGGWSAGGLLAHEAIRQLGENGIIVNKMLLLDSPSPFGLKSPAKRMSSILNDLGVFGGGKRKAPDWLLEHFDGMASVLERYMPMPIPMSSVPNTLLVYARDGVSNDYQDVELEKQPENYREVRWLLKNRDDFAAKGWIRLIGSNKLSIEVMDDVNHFSIMDDGPNMARLGRVLVDFLRRL